MGSKVEAMESLGEPALTILHALFGEPEGHTVAMEVLLPLAVDLELDLQLPVPEVAGLGGQELMVNAKRTAFIQHLF